MPEKHLGHLSWRSMPTEPPPRPKGSRGDGPPKRPRPAAPAAAGEDEGAGSRGRGAKPESLREALSRIPDIDGEAAPRRPGGPNRPAGSGRAGGRRPTPGVKDFGLGPVPPGTEGARPRPAARRQGDGPGSRPTGEPPRPGPPRRDGPPPTRPAGPAAGKPGPAAKATKASLPAPKKRPLPVRPPRDVIATPAAAPTSPVESAKSHPVPPAAAAPKPSPDVAKPQSLVGSVAPAGPEARVAPVEPVPEPPTAVAAVAKIAATKASVAITLDTGEVAASSDAPAGPDATTTGDGSKVPPDRGHRFKAEPEPMRERQPWWRRLGFAAAVLLLAASIPVLGREGYRLVAQSRDGTVGPGAPGPQDPGYEELVTSTPTALIIQKDSAGLPVALMFLALSNGDAGGSVIFVPLDTEVPEPGFGVDRLRTAYSAVAHDPVGATSQLSGQTGKVLNVGIDETFELDDRGWSQIVASVAPLTIDNPEPIDLASGTLASGQVSLAAEQVGPYLAAVRPGEDGVAAFFRQELVLRAWLSAVATQGDGAVSGELARYINTLARGEVTFATVPGEFAGGFPEPIRYEPDASALNDLVTELVPAPVAPAPGARITVRLLNGVQPGGFPGDIIRTVVSMQGSVAVLGNGPSFGRTETTVLYSDPAKEAYARALLDALGGTGEVTQDPSLSDLIDLTVILGSDVIGDNPSGTASTSTSTVSTTSPSTTADPGVPVFEGGTTSEPGGL